MSADAAEATWRAAFAAIEELRARADRTDEHAFRDETLRVLGLLAEVPGLVGGPVEPEVDPDRWGTRRPGRRVAGARTIGLRTARIRAHTVTAVGSGPRPLPGVQFLGWRFADGPCAGRDVLAVLYEEWRDLAPLLRAGELTPTGPAGGICG